MISAVARSLSQSFWPKSTSLQLLPAAPLHGSRRVTTERAARCCASCVAQPRRKSKRGGAAPRWNTTQQGPPPRDSRRVARLLTAGAQQQGKKPAGIQASNMWHSQAAAPPLHTQPLWPGAITSKPGHSLARRPKCAARGAQPLRTSTRSGSLHPQLWGPGASGTSARNSLPLQAMKYLQGGRRGGEAQQPQRP